MFVFTTVFFILHIFISPTFLWDPGLRSPPLCLKSLKSSEFIFRLINIPVPTLPCLPAFGSSFLILYLHKCDRSPDTSEKCIDNSHNSCLILTKVITLHCIYWYIWWRCIKSLVDAVLQSLKVSLVCGYRRVWYLYFTLDACVSMWSQTSRD